MLTEKQKDLLLFIHKRVKDTGVSPSFDEMKDALGLASKSGVHRLITALVERGFLRRLPNRARALEVVRLPDETLPSLTVHKGEKSITPNMPPMAADAIEMPVLGRIAAGVPIEAIQEEITRVAVPTHMMGHGEHFALEVQGESMIEAGILDGDYVVIRKTQSALPGDIVVALVDQEEATLKTYRRKGQDVILEAANPAYENRILSPNRVGVQGKLVGLIRRYH